MLKLAHRGDWRNAPENSLDALVAACRLPHVDGVEFDVRLSADGVPVLAHDDDLSRVHGLDRRVREATARELQRLRVATLEDVLDEVPADCFLDVELKEDIASVAAAVLLAGRGAAPDRAVVSSFDPATLAHARAAAPRWPRWLISQTLDERTLAEATSLSCAAVALESAALNPANIAKARRRGMNVVGWTITDRTAVEPLGALGLLALCVEGAALES